MVPIRCKGSHLASRTLQHCCLLCFNVQEEDVIATRVADSLIVDKAKVLVWESLNPASERATEC